MLRAIWRVGKSVARKSLLSKYERRISISVALILCSFISYAQATEPQVKVDSVEAQLLFPIGKSQINLNFSDNAAQMGLITRAIESIQGDSTQRLSRIHIVGYASPDGSYQFNQRLSRSRADNLAKYLQTKFVLSDTIFTHRYAGIDWEGLYDAVGRSQLGARDKVQDIIRHEPELTYNSKGALVRSRKQQLMNLDAGRTWGWLMQNIYPQLRRSTMVVCYIEQLPAAAAQEPDTLSAETTEPGITLPPIGTAEAIAADSIATDTIAPVPDPYTRYPVAALRSNLLVPLLNVGIEVPVAKHWSVGADYYYPWIWPDKSNKDCFELIFISAEARYWFKPNTNPDLPEKNCLAGHSIGLYGAWGYYDLERNYHGHQGHAWSAGLDYVYALPISKNRLRLEFQLAVGAIWSPKAKPYNVYEYGGHLIREHGVYKNFFYLGPTKVGVSLVVPLHRKVKLQTPEVP